MKKTYFKPETTVVVLNANSNLMQASNAELDKTQQIENANDFGGREVIKTSDAWEEW